MEKEDRFLLIFMAIIICLFVGGIVTFVVIDGDRRPQYSVAIYSVSGLDDLAAASATGPRALLDDPLFNLTLRVASWGLLHGECVEPGTAVEVAYRGVPLATGTALRLCTGPRKRQREQHVVAWGRGVRLPGFALDALAAEVRRRGGVEQVAFDITLLMPSTHSNGHEGKVVTCRARRVGDAAALGAPCDASDVDAILIPSPSVQHGGASSPSN